MVTLAEALNTGVCWAFGNVFYLFSHNVCLVWCKGTSRNIWQHSEHFSAWSCSHAVLPRRRERPSIPPRTEQYAVSPPIKQLNASSSTSFLFLYKLKIVCWLPGRHWDATKEERSLAGWRSPWRRTRRRGRPRSGKQRHRSPTRKQKKFARLQQTMC